MGRVATLGWVHPFEKLTGHYRMNLTKAFERLRAEGLTEEELIAVNVQLQLVAQTCAAHLTYMDDAGADVTDDDEGLAVLEEAFMFLYHIWLENQQADHLPEPKQLH